jgi:hypothetical protein|tara:strand:+ start:170 stop:517 length:348 start_codon:yes stop_codon:yes gene_type:complete
MIELEQYQDIQIIQNTDFENTITFEAPHDTENYDYKVVIAPDYASSATFNLGVGSGLTKTGDQTLTMKLTDAQTDDFVDNYEGVWELVSKKTSDGTLTRELQGDVVVSPGLVPVW